jgi:hypothetical protein
MRRNRPLVYLCGPIQGLTFDEADTWRQEAEFLLHPEFGVLSPLRGKSYSGRVASGYTDEEIVVRDLADIRRSALVLRYCPGPGHGSDMETFYASHTCGLPVVVFGSGVAGPREALPIWLRRHTVKNFGTLREAVDYIKSMWGDPEQQAA